MSKKAVALNYVCSPDLMDFKTILQTEFDLLLRIFFYDIVYATLSWFWDLYP